MSFQEHLSRYSGVVYEKREYDLYVSPNGREGASGSQDDPMNSIREALDAAVKTGKRSIGLKRGEYRLTEGLVLNAEHNGLVLAGVEDGVEITGALRLPAEKWRALKTDELTTLPAFLRGKIVCCDLKQFGASRADWGDVYPIGMYGSEKKYDDYVPGSNCEVYCRGKRMTLCRYPHEGYLKLKDVPSAGDCREYPLRCFHPDWNGRRNHDGGEYMLDDDTAERVRHWKYRDHVWMYGYFMLDWADSSTPIRAFDDRKGTVFPAHASVYGAAPGGLYYFYNIPDEMTCEGDWYLDRETGLLYVYPPAGGLGEMEINLLSSPILTLNDTRDVTVEHLTVLGTKADAVRVSGSGNTVYALKIRNTEGNGVVVDGTDNRVKDCEIFDIAGSGIILKGGERETLTPGGNSAVNNLIHDWAQVWKTYHPGVELFGVHQICAHNEMYNAPHSAVIYHGNDHLIEYNVIHDCVTHSSDAGAIYAGRDWTACGTVVRYNCIYDIGGAGFDPDGIYFDDMLSGQTAYGNLLVNVKKNAFLIGGGRDNHIYGNIAAHCGTGIKYDDRGSDAFFRDGWAKDMVCDMRESVMWINLRKMPYQSCVWKKSYPSLAQLTEDPARGAEAAFAVNPADSEVYGNLLIASAQRQMSIYPDVEKFSRVGNNGTFESEEAAGLIKDEYVFAVSARPEGFEPLPLEQMGRN